VFTHDTPLAAAWATFDAMMFDGRGYQRLKVNPPDLDEFTGPAA
jgi:hypothetical protein